MFHSAPLSATADAALDRVTQLLRDDAMLREATMLADGWRVTKVWFGEGAGPDADHGGDQDGTAERTRLAALVRVDEALRARGAMAQTRVLICPDHAQWRFRPGRHRPDDLVALVGGILAQLDPGGWRVKADRF